MVEAIWETLKQYGLIGQVSFVYYHAHTSNKLYYAKIIAIVMDNATNNNMMMVAIQQRCNEAKVYFSAVKSWLHCMLHTVHLAVIKVCASCHTSLSESEVITSTAPQGNRCTIQG